MITSAGSSVSASDHSQNDNALSKSSSTSSVIPLLEKNSQAAAVVQTMLEPPSSEHDPLNKAINEQNMDNVMMHSNRWSIELRIQLLKRKVHITKIC